MPKQIYNETDFSGGINGIDSPRDVPEGQVVKGKSVSFDERGRVRMMGKAVMFPITDSISNGYVNPGFESGTSFFRFEYDYAMLEGTDSASPGFDATPQALETAYFALGNQRYVAIWDSVANYWFCQAIDMAADAGAGNLKVQFYFLNGALRCYNPTFTAGVFPRWHGHIKRTLFDSSSSGEQAKSEWYTTTTKLLPPDGNTALVTTIGSEKPGRSIIVDEAGSITLVSGSTPGTTGVDMLQICLDDLGTSGTWIGTVVYTFYLSYIYDGSQESPVGTATTMSIADTTTLSMGVIIDYNATLGTDFNGRITGARVYYSDPADGEGTKYHLLDIDFVKGCRKFNEEDWTDWNLETGTVFECPADLEGATLAATSNTFDFEDMPKSVTYDILNGYGPTEETDIQFKCHAVLNNSLYVGNIKHSDGSTFPDRIVKSPIRFDGLPQYDTFPIVSGILDIAANDGDSIIAMEGYADRLLVFKKKNVYVVNISEGGGYVETKLANMGVNSVNQVTATRHGVVWVNRSGCFLYNEGQPINLLTDGLATTGRFITPDMKWYINENKNPAIAFLPRLNKLLVSLGLDGGFSNDAWLYNFDRKSWSFGGGTIGDWQQERSNFAVDASGDAYLAQNNAGALEILNWSDSSKSHNEFNVLFRDFDAEQPNIRKKFYKAYLQFRCSARTNIIAKYAVNGNYSLPNDFDTTQDGITTAGELEFTTTQTNLISVNPDFNLGSHLVLTAIPGTPGDIWNFGNDSLGWHAVEVADGGFANLQGGTANWKNDADSDVIIFQAITVVNDVTYKLSFQNIIEESFRNPAVMCFITTSNDAANEGACTHAHLEDNTYYKAFVVGQGSGTFSVNFTADENNVWYVCFRTVKLPAGDDPDVFANWDPYNQASNNLGSVSQASVKREDEWSTAVLKPDTSSEANNIYSMAIRLDVRTAGTTYVPSDFEIDNISYVYRSKNIK